MSKKGKTKMSKKTKGIIAGATALVVVLIGGILWKQQQDAVSTDAMKEPYSAVNVTEGSIASSTLLSGTVKALSEEYIYFDAVKVRMRR
ncbi:macrolide-specific efflux protein macA [Streptococcus dysgalactiae]|nr:macrolide-specific efflux protein macA [Streptococcus dysgalactiae]